MTIEPRTNSHLHRNGLIYGQPYNSSKIIFAVGSTYPFANAGLDTLAADKKLVRSWQRVWVQATSSPSRPTRNILLPTIRHQCHQGGAVGVNPETLLRAYLHAKARGHVAWRDVRDKSFGIREEYCVTLRLFDEIDAAIDTPTAGNLPPSADNLHNHHAFFSHPTPIFLDFLGWSMTDGHNYRPTFGWLCGGGGDLGVRGRMALGFCGHLAIIDPLNRQCH